MTRRTAFRHCAALVAAVAAMPALGCTDRLCTPGGDINSPFPPCELTVEPATGSDQTELVVLVTPYHTRAAAAGTGCAIAVTQIDGYELRAVGFVDSEGAPVRAFQFRPNPAPAESLRGLAYFRDGFFGRLQEDVTGGDIVSLQLRLAPVAPEEGYAGGAPVLDGVAVAFGAARADGRFSSHHLEVHALAPEAHHAD